MKQTQVNKIAVEFEGVRPMMFDRYAGDNNTSLPVPEKMYLEGRHLIMPSTNIYSLLCAKNGESVCKRFFGGTAGKDIGLGISSYTSIEPFEIPILCNGKQIEFNGFNEQIFIHHGVARLLHGVPNPKERPTLALPWTIKFEMEYIENKLCTLENLRQALAKGGIIGLGTFRPYFGRYELAQFDVL